MIHLPLSGYLSLCKKNASEIVSRDKGSPRCHRGMNANASYVTHYKIDGVVIKNGNKCDFLLINETAKIAYLIEVKGSDLSWAAKQLFETEKRLSSQLSAYSLRYRIVASKCKTQEIHTTEFNKYRLLWKKNLKYSTNQIIEPI